MQLEQLLSLLLGIISSPMELDQVAALFGGFLVGVAAMTAPTIVRNRPPRLAYEPKVPKKRPPIRALILGAGALGDVVYHELVNCRSHHVEVVGYIDNDVQKKGKYLNGVPVLGSPKDLLDVIEKQQVNLLIKAILSPKVLSETAEVKEAVHYKKVLFLDPSQGYRQVEKIFAEVVKDIDGASSTEET